MHIPSIQNVKNYKNNSANINFRAIIFENYNANYNDSKETLRYELDKFTKNSNNAKFLGAGLSAKAYILQNLPNFVMKEAHNNNETFEQEAVNINNIESNYANKQKFVARAYDDKLKKYYLITTKVAGATPHPENAPLSTKHLNSLFSKLYEMDINGIYHGDLNLGNIKLTAYGDVHFIDFQWMQKINEYKFFEENPSISHPQFLMCENLQMLEMAGIPYYLQKIEDDDERNEFFDNYLKAKSKYHQKRAEFIKNKIDSWPYSSEIPYLKKALKFENAQAEVFKNPSKEVKDIEILKMQFLNSFRQAYKFVDENIYDKNILQGASAYLLTLLNIQNLKHYLYTSSQKYNSQYMNDYTEGLNMYADYWFDNIKEWSENALYFPIRHINKPLLEWEKKRYDFKNPQINYHIFKNVFNISDFLPLSHDLNSDYQQFSQQYSQYNVKQLNLIPIDKTYLKNNEVINNLEQLNILYEKIAKLSEQRKTLDVINNALLGLLLTNQTIKMLSDDNYAYESKNLVSKLRNNEDHYEYLAKNAAFDINCDISNAKNRNFSIVFNYPNSNIFE